MFFKLTKRCEYCAHVLRDDGTCQNEKCIAYKPETATTDTGTTTTPADTASEGG